MADTNLPAIPDVRKAIVQSAMKPGTLELRADQPMPDLPPDSVMIKVEAVALNHCDWKMPARVPCPGAVDGTDFAGTIVRLGESAARESGFAIGDRVAGAQVASHPPQPWSGSYSEYIVEKAVQCWPVPENLSWEEAASVGAAVTSSVGIALWHTLQLAGTPEEPVSHSKFVLVYGGATACGTFAIQVLKLSGYRVITTCSPKNFEFVESYGAEKAFDYRSPTVAEDIKAYTKNTLEYALDTITKAKTLRHCYAAIGRGGGRYAGLEEIPPDLIATMRKTVKSGWVMGPEVSGLELELPGNYHRDANPELHIWYQSYIRRLAALYGAGKLRTHPIQVKGGGLANIVEGLGALERGEVSAVKLVYPLYGQA
ncbi:GroES-like protein [Trichoderma chlorosporum]